MMKQWLGRLMATLILAVPVHAKVSAQERVDTVLSADAIVAVAGSEQSAEGIAQVALAQDAVRRFTRAPSNGDVVALLDSQWHEQWVPKDGIVDVQHGRRVKFLRLSQTDATARYEQGGRLLVLRGLALVEGKLTVSVVDQGSCSSTGMELIFRHVDGHWRQEGEPKDLGDMRAPCGRP